MAFHTESNTTTLAVYLGIQLSSPKKYLPLMPGGGGLIPGGGIPIGEPRPGGIPIGGPMGGLIPGGGPIIPRAEKQKHQQLTAPSLLPARPAETSE